MRFLIPLFLAWSAVAQLPTIPSGFNFPQPTFGSPGPQTISGLAYYWVASDLPVGITVSNWIDRIQGAVWTNGATSLRPTNSASGIYFSGSTSLTNSVIFFTANSNFNKIWILGKFVKNNPASGADNWMTGEDSARGIALGATKVIDAVTQTPYYNCITNIPVDTLIAGSSGVASSLITTNNVSTGKTLNWVSTGTHYFSGLATTAIGNTRGSFYTTEIAIFTNDITAGQAITLHTYATNSSALAPYAP